MRALWFIPIDVRAQDAETVKALDAALERFTTLFNNHDAEALSNEYARDANALWTDGKQMNSREDVRASLAEFFQKNPHVKTKFSDVTRKMLTRRIVVENGIWHESGHSEKGLPTKGMYSAIMMQRQGKWLIVHDRAWTMPEQNAD